MCLFFFPLFLSPPFFYLQKRLELLPVERTITVFVGEHKRLFFVCKKKTAIISLRQGQRPRGFFLRLKKNELAQKKRGGLGRFAGISAGGVARIEFFEDIISVNLSHTHKHTPIHTQTQTHGHTDTQTHRHTQKHRHTQTHRHTCDIIASISALDMPRRKYVACKQGNILV